ncbi:TetR/AcrR family transcriptional regulator [Bacillus sp. 31A1R]|uniref:TetR/AcrR family transcriptional regulator n=1 Tax=Robertmurraya mangrovi TaxID=3098077 RepID=A0ABU5IX87_9BACI|nr:TetR/AcrR family transcriptional regulator [Bacillus sp. 31A1R]MDZ5471727.1 TetR/AcrR family transcriptional regulator [Bacillus sp. 31A1R]
MRGFTEIEREQIQSQLFDKGKELFSAHGLKKTSIKELTDSVGIAQGSFYLFFQSKEELYFRILEREEEAIKKSLLSELVLPMNAKHFKDFLLKGINLISVNPLIRRLYFEGELELLIRKLPEKIVEAHIKNDEDLLKPLLRSFGIGEGKEEQISGAIRGFFIMVLHKKEIGEATYDSAIEFLAEAISNQIFKDDKS